MRNLKLMAMFAGVAALAAVLTVPGPASAAPDTGSTKVRTATTGTGSKVLVAATGTGSVRPDKVVASGKIALPAGEAKAGQKSTAAVGVIECEWFITELYINIDGNVEAFAGVECAELVDRIDITVSMYLNNALRTVNGTGLDFTVGWYTRAIPVPCFNGSLYQAKAHFFVENDGFPAEADGSNTPMVCVFA